MGVQPQEAPVSKTAAQASSYTRTRSKSGSATTPTVKGPSKTTKWEQHDKDLSVLSSPAPKSASRKRKKLSRAYAEGDMQIQDREIEGSIKKRKTASPKTASPKKASPKKKDEENRLRHCRSHAPGTYLQRLERAQSQRCVSILHRSASRTVDTMIDTLAEC